MRKHLQFFSWVGRGWVKPNVDTKLKESCSLRQNVCPGYPEGGVPQPADGLDGHAGPPDGQGEHHATAQPADPLLSRQPG